MLESWSLVRQPPKQLPRHAAKEDDLSVVWYHALRHSRHCVTTRRENAAFEELLNASPARPMQPNGSDFERLLDACI